MAKILCIGDTHFENKRLTENKMLSERIIKVVEKHSADLSAVVFLGDILHFHGRVEVLSYNIFLELVDQIRKTVHVFVLIGNHDYINNTQWLTTNHVFNALKYWDNVSVIDKPEIFEVDHSEFTFCPYVPPGRFKEALDTTLKTSWRQTKCIFAHQEIFGCKLLGSVSISGDKWSAKRPPVVSGHIHVTHTLRCGVTYTGSSVQIYPNESPDKYFFFVSCNPEQDKKLSITKTPTGMPKKQLITVTVAEAEKITLTGDMWGTTLKVIGTFEEICKFKSSKTLKKIRDKTKVIVTFFVVKRSESVKVSSSTLESILEELLNANKELKNLFERVCLKKTDQ